MARIIQVASVKVTTPQSTTLSEPTFAPLLTLPLEVHGGRVLVLFSASFFAGPAPSGLTNPLFRFTVDGAPIVATSGCVFNSLGGCSVALDWVVPPPAPGVRVFAIEWTRGVGSVVGSTAILDPVALPNRHHGSLVLLEIAG